CRIRHTSSYGDWSSDVCSSDLYAKNVLRQSVFYVSRFWLRNECIKFNLLEKICACEECEIESRVSNSSGYFSFPHFLKIQLRIQIGRASCRERVYIQEVVILLY